MSVHIQLISQQPQAKKDCYFFFVNVAYLDLFIQILPPQPQARTLPVFYTKTIIFAFFLNAVFVGFVYTDIASTATGTNDVSTCSQKNLFCFV